MAAVPRYTYDGLPVARDEPHGAAVVVWRPAATSAADREYLVLHRAHNGPGYEGDWAWTPPSGARQPGESVLGAALREVAEESGIAASPADLEVLDLSGAWARFRLAVPGDRLVRIDAEHDRFDWLALSAAIDRCEPPHVADGLRLAQAVLAADIGFRPLARTDLAALVAWQRAPHVARWFPERLDLAAAERKYGPRIAGTSPTRVHIAVADGRDAGFLQHYRVGDYPDYAAATGLPDAIGVDYAIGRPELTGAGLGPQLIWSYLRDVVLPAHPAARYALASPDVANVRSVRALAKAGFRPAGLISVPGDQAPEQLCVLDLGKFLARRAVRSPQPPGRTSRPPRSGP